MIVVSGDDHTAQKRWGKIAKNKENITARDRQGGKFGSVLDAALQVLHIQKHARGVDVEAVPSRRSIIHAIQTHTAHDEEELLDIMESFMENNVLNDGHLKESEFIKGMKEFSSCDNEFLLHRMFVLFDNDGDGTIDENELSTGLKVFLRHSMEAQVRNLSLRLPSPPPSPSRSFPLSCAGASHTGMHFLTAA